MNRLSVQFKKQYLINILVLCVSTVITLLMAEIVLRLVIPNGYYIWPPHVKMVFKLKPGVMPGISGESRFETNSKGIRGDEFTSSQTYRILTIGGSTTECMYLDQFETWPYQLQMILNENAPNHNVWVGIGGMAGKTTRHHLTAIQYLPLRKLKIDAIILFIGINDLSIRLSRDELYDPRFLSKPEATEKLLKETFKGTRGLGLHQSYSFFKKTVVWQMLSRVKVLIFHNEVEQGGEEYATWRIHRQHATEIRTELPDLSAALEEYVSNINKIIDIAQKKLVRLIFMTQATMWKPGLPKELDSLLWFGGVGNFQKEIGKPYYSAEALEKGMKKYNDALINVCQQRGVECIDLSFLEKDTTVFFDDCHFNENGARKVAMALGKHILSREPFVADSNVTLRMKR